MFPLTRSRLGTVLLMIVVLLAASGARAETVVEDLLVQGAWLAPDPARWSFEAGTLLGETAVFDGDKADPEASTFLRSSRTYSGDLRLTMTVTFDVGRYLGAYLDFGQESRTGIWMATGHPLPAEELEHHVESAYVKTVDNAHWIVRATGELDIVPGEPITIEFRRTGDDYSVWHAERPIASYRVPGGYPPGPLQLRLTNARARISRLSIEADEVQ